MIMIDMFGLEVTEEGKWKGGYAACPGTGPCGETCGSCGNFNRVSYHEKTYFKCEKIIHWTHGPGTDIRKKSPACSFWSVTNQKKEV